MASTARDFADVTPGAKAPPPLHLPRLCVGDIMTRNVLCVRPELSLDAALQALVENRLKAAPVVDGRGVIVGIVSENDVLLDVHARPDGGTRTVADVLMPVPYTLPPEASITRAAAIMVSEELSHLVVASENGVVRGLVSTFDVLWWVARADGFVLPSPQNRSP
jgi:CBS domain-containing protein